MLCIAHMMGASQELWQVTAGLHSQQACFTSSAVEIVGAWHELLWNLLGCRAPVQQVHNHEPVRSGCWLDGEHRLCTQQPG